MKLGEFARRARTSRLQRKARFDAAFERARRDLQLPEISEVQRRPPTVIRSESQRPILTLFPRT